MDLHAIYFKVQVFYVEVLYKSFFHWKKGHYYWCTGRLSLKYRLFIIEVEAIYILLKYRPFFIKVQAIYIEEQAIFYYSSGHFLLKYMPHDAWKKITQIFAFYEILFFRQINVCQGNYPGWHVKKTLVS